MKELDRSAVEALVVQGIQELLDDSDLDLGDPITGETTLNEDLCLSSVEAMELFARVDVAIGRRLQYEKLVMSDGQYRSELTVGELVEFVWANQDASAPPAQAM